MSHDPAVLYVEDNPNSRKVMKILLAGRLKLPHVNIFEDSHEFVSRVQALDPQPDIVFLDIHVEPHSGFEMLKMLRELKTFERTPIVALTASVMNEEVHLLRTAGFDGCLAKPVDTDTFPDLFRRILNGETIWRIL